MKPSSTNSRTLNSKHLLIMLVWKPRKLEEKEEDEEEDSLTFHFLCSAIIIIAHQDEDPTNRTKGGLFWQPNSRASVFYPELTFFFFSVFSLFLANQSRKIIGFTRAVITFFLFFRWTVICLLFLGTIYIFF